MILSSVAVMSPSFNLASKLVSFNWFWTFNWRMTGLHQLTLGSFSKHVHLSTMSDIHGILLAHCKRSIFEEGSEQQFLYEDLGLSRTFSTGSFVFNFLLAFLVKYCFIICEESFSVRYYL